MGLFNFIETFFFISLGITFVLILLLVYHFKQRLSALEQKGDTMFEIINNLVQEVTMVRSVTNRMIQGMAFGSPMSNIAPEHMPVQHIHLVNEEDGDEDDASEAEDEASEAEDEVSEADDEASEADDEEDEDEDDEDEDDEEDEVENSEAEDLVKNDVDIVEKSIEMVDEIVELETVGDLETILTENINNFIEQIEMNTEDKVETMVENIDELVENLDEVTESTESTDYKNMNLQTLKTLAVAKGLVTNASKLKKNELLKLLGETV
jgi:cobalamin biosynthesis protein CobT